jgi:hypothetical protein
MGEGSVRASLRLVHGCLVGVERSDKFTYMATNNCRVASNGWSQASRSQLSGYDSFFIANGATRIRLAYIT